MSVKIINEKSNSGPSSDVKVTNGTGSVAVLKPGDSGVYDDAAGPLSVAFSNTSPKKS
jgi:hypothetical protein